MHKLFYSFFCSIFISFTVMTQELVEFSMGSGYAYDIFYSLENGITAYPERSNWDLAFSTNPSHNNIRINSGNGVMLFYISDNLDDWNTIESLPSDAIQLRNSNIDWSIGAFVSNASGGLNYGWGNYNPETAITEGSSIYIINYESQSKKIRINSVVNGLFDVTIANLDGSNEQSFNINTSDYINKRFIYYSLTNMELLDREPNSDNWDFVFTKYEANLNKSNNDSNLFYTVTGGLTNGNMIFEYDGFLDVNPETDIIVEGASSNINTIGWDWKQYIDNEYNIVSNRSYFIFNQASTDLYKLVFQSFAGGESGNCSFLIESVEYEPTNIVEVINTSDINIYPNPSTGSFKMNSTSDKFDFFIQDVNGRIVLHKEYEENMSIDLAHFSEGLYFLILEDNNEYINKKIIIQR